MLLLTNPYVWKTVSRTLFVTHVGSTVLSPENLILLEIQDTCPVKIEQGRWQLPM